MAGFARTGCKFLNTAKYANTFTPQEAIEALL